MQSFGLSTRAPRSDSQIPPSIFVGAPNYKGASGAFVISMLKLQTALARRKGKMIPWLMENESNIDRARGKACAAFLKTDAQYLLFQDTDIGVDGEAILQMAALDLPIIGATICMKEIDFERMIQVARENPDLPLHTVKAWGTAFAFSGDPQDWDDLMKPQAIPRIGTGCMLIRRDVIERLWQVHAAELGCKHQGVYFVNLFQCTINRLTCDQIGTDYSFCDRAKAEGFQTYIAPWVSTTHRGEYTFKSSLMDLT